MSITEYYKDGQKLHEVYVNIRSSRNPSIRVQKRKKGLKTASKAKATEKSLIEKAYFEIAQKEQTSKRWGQLVEQWHEYKKIDTFEPIGEETLSDYYSALKNWTGEFWCQPYTKLNRSEIKKLIVRLESIGKSKSFQAKMKLMINNVFKWGIDEGIVDEFSQSPTHGIPVNRKEEKLPEILSLSEIRKLLSFARQDNNPWFPIWFVALHTGCRSGELFALTWDNVDFENSKILIHKSYNGRQKRIKSTKGSYWRTVPMNSELFSFLRNLEAKSKGNDVLPKLRDWRHGYQARELRKFCTGIGITSVKFHTLRSCFATQLLQNGVPPIVVMKIGGWKSLETMQRYIRRAGLDESGATDELFFTTDKEACERIAKEF
jgi:integrase